MLVRAARCEISRFGDGLYPGPKWCSLKKMPSKPRAFVGDPQVEVPAIVLVHGLGVVMTRRVMHRVEELEQPRLDHQALLCLRAVPAATATNPAMRPTFFVKSFFRVHALGTVQRPERKCGDARGHQRRHEDERCRRRQRRNEQCGTTDEVSDGVQTNERRRRHRLERGHRLLDLVGHARALERPGLQDVRAPCGRLR